MRIGVDGIESHVLEGVGGNFVRDADATALLLEVDDGTAIISNVFERHFKLFFAVTSLTAKDLARKTLVVNPHRHLLGTPSLPSLGTKRRLVRAINYAWFAPQSCSGTQRMRLARHIVDAVSTQAKVTNVCGKIGLGDVGGGRSGIGVSTRGNDSLFDDITIVDGLMFRYSIKRANQCRRSYFWFRFYIFGTSHLFAVRLLFGLGHGERRRGGWDGVSSSTSSPW
mmetsp:Transcript_26359/g.55051  ORF Transcript_26359/g.55051 Transcript_26359/m.55051 type:complete len:225 (-) Transcript_26359:265-939(-)